MPREQHPCRTRGRDCSRPRDVRFATLRRPERIPGSHPGTRHHPLVGAARSGGSMLHVAVHLCPRSFASVGAGTAGQCVDTAGDDGVKHCAVGRADSPAQVRLARTPGASDWTNSFAVDMKSVGFNYHLWVPALPPGVLAQPLRLPHEPRTWQIPYTGLEQLRPSAHVEARCPTGIEGTARRCRGQSGLGDMDCRRRTSRSCETRLWDRS